jgi:hypothetical protein
MILSRDQDITRARRARVHLARKFHLRRKRRAMAGKVVPISPSSPSPRSGERAIGGWRRKGSPLPHSRADHGAAEGRQRRPAPAPCRSRSPRKSPRPTGNLCSPSMRKSAISHRATCVRARVRSARVRACAKATKRQQAARHGEGEWTAPPGGGAPSQGRASGGARGSRPRRRGWGPEGGGGRKPPPAKRKAPRHPAWQQDRRWNGQAQHSHRAENAWERSRAGTIRSQASESSSPRPRAGCAREHGGCRAGP